MNRKLALALIMGAIVIVAMLAFAGTAAGQGGSSCDQDPFCEKYDDPGNSGTLTAPGPIWKFVIKAGTSKFPFYPPGGNDGCYLVTFSNDNMTVSWSKIGSGPTCKDVSHVQLWWTQNTPTQTPTGGTPEITPTDEPTVVITPTDEPTVVITPTDEPTVVITPTDEPTVVITPTDEPTVVITPTETTTGPTATPTFVATQTSTPSKTDVPSFACDNVRVPAGGATLEWQDGAGNWHFGAYVTGESLVLAMGSAPTGSTFRLVKDGAEVLRFTIEDLGCTIYVPEVPVVESPCPTCPPAYCEWVEGAENIFVKGESVGVLFATEDIESDETTGEYNVKFDLTEDEARSLVEGDLIVSGVQCSICPEAPIVFERDGQWYALYARDLSNESNLVVAFMAQGFTHGQATQMAREASNGYRANGYKSGYYPVTVPQGE